MPLRVSSVYKSNIVIDGEVIPIRIKRIAPKEAIEFYRDFARTARSAKAGDIPKDMVGEARAAFIEKAEKDEEAAKTFMARCIAQFITVETGHIFVDDSEESITQGEDLVRIFGARDDVLGELLMQAYLENKLNAEEKEYRKTRLAPFVPTPEAVADRMMAMANVGPLDTVIDLGCGNGRLCVAAAKCGAKVFGYDIDADRIQEAQAAAEAAGVTALCTFEQKDALTVDLTSATVVTLYLLGGANAKLRPVLLQQLPDGARVISHAFTMGGDWIPDAVEQVPLPEGEELVHGGQRWVYVYSVDRWRKSHPGAKVA